MSTILKALNKAEPNPTIVRQRIGAETSPPNAARRFKGNFWKKRGRIYLLAAVILCVVVGWQYFRYSSMAPKKQDIKTYRIAKPSTEETIPPVSQGQVSNRPSDSPMSVAKNRNKRRVQSPEDKGSSRRASTPVLPGKTDKKGQTHLPKQPIKKDLLQDIREKRHASPNALDPSAGTKDRARNLQPITDKGIQPRHGKKIESRPDNTPSWRDAPALENSKMKLQALAWARQPEKRMVVIDGQVIREGDDVNGYSVKKIRENDIILQQNKKYFRLSFNR
jgi:hypothetical protein